MEKTLSFALKSLVDQVKSAHPAGAGEQEQTYSDRAPLPRYVLRNLPESPTEGLHRPLHGRPQPLSLRSWTKAASWLASSRLLSADKRSASVDVTVRLLANQGHDVRLIAGQHVKAYLSGNKNDSNDAAAIAEARTRAMTKYVPVNTEAQQDLQMMHRVHQGLIERRTGVINQARGLLGEYGIVIAIGARALRRELAAILVSDTHSLSATALEQQLDDAAGIAQQLVPHEHSTGGRQRLFGISKRGDRYLRILLIHGARSALQWAHKRTDRILHWAGGPSTTQGHQRGWDGLDKALATQLSRGTKALALLRVSDGEDVLTRAVYVAFKKEGDEYVPDVQKTLEDLFKNNIFKGVPNNDLFTGLADGSITVESIPGYRMSYAGDPSLDDNAAFKLVADVKKGQNQRYEMIFGTDGNRFAKVILPGIARNDTIGGFSPFNILADEPGTYLANEFRTPLIQPNAQPVPLVLSAEAAGPAPDSAAVEEQFESEMEHEAESAGPRP
ncbi:hypothetical protein DFQ30_000887 [Apophysomyces sp. BC1015]|nr:hypothetical protein DFQ30_000887 [Apophysomyces sp. BC1015]